MVILSNILILFRYLMVLPATTSPHLFFLRTFAKPVLTDRLNLPKSYKVNTLPLFISRNISKSQGIQRKVVSVTELNFTGLENLALVMEVINLRIGYIKLVVRDAGFNFFQLFLDHFVIFHHNRFT